MQSQAPGEPRLNPRRPPDLKTVGSALRHRRAVFAIILLGCVALSATLALVRPKTYEATALLYVDERHNSSQGFDLALQAGELLSHHYIEMATSREVLQAACGASDGSTPASGPPCSPDVLAGQVHAGTVRGTSLIGV